VFEWGNYDTMHHFQDALPPRSTRSCTDVGAIGLRSNIIHRIYPTHGIYRAEYISPLKTVPTLAP
jgi:hypothetical protein